jgi:nucleoside-diphosphate-sugar epimerase
MRIFVTGGSGFVGSAIIRELVMEGHEVTGLVRRKSKAEIVERSGGNVVFGDLLEPGSWTGALRDSELIITASQPVRFGEKVSLSEARRRSYYHGQMVGNLFLAAEGSYVKGIILTYGVQGFGNRGDRWITEADELNPYGYDRSVTGAYWHIDKTSRKTRVPLVNVFTGWVYGPGGWFEPMVRGIKNGSMRVVGDGSNYMSLIHVDDLARAYARLVEKMPVGERYCLVDGEPVTKHDLTGFLAKYMGARPPKTIDFDSYASLAGDLAAETMSCSSRVSAEKMKKRLLPELKYPSYLMGMPNVIEDMGILQKEERAEPVSGSEGRAA